jgi:hypothetical protein
MPLGASPSSCRRLPHALARPLVRPVPPPGAPPGHAARGVYLSILSPARPGPLARPGPGPPTNLTGRAWAEILKPAKIFWPEPGPKCCF